MTPGGPRLLAGAVLGAVLLAVGAARTEHSLEMIQESGPPENRVDLAILGDGYTEDEQGLFAEDADRAVASLFASTPYAEYLPLFNIARIDTISAESGADHPSQDHYADTFFGCYFDCMGLPHLICCDYAAIFSAAAEVYPAYDVLLLLVNDGAYGGSGGPVAVSSTNVHGFDIPPHEFGHTFAGLGDEYDDPYPGFQGCEQFPNISSTADIDLLKWAHWVDDATPLPTPPSAATGKLHPVGAYEGACYQPTGFFRPAPLCLMRSLGSTLCPVCSEQMVRAFWGYVDPVDEFGPAEAELAGEAGEVLELWVEPVRPDPDTVEVRWLVNGLPIPGAHHDALELPVTALVPGVNEVTALVEDVTPLVIDDDEALLSSAVTWYVTRMDDGTDTDHENAAGSTFSALSGGCDCSSTGRSVGALGALVRMLAGVFRQGVMKMGSGTHGLLMISSISAWVVNIGLWLGLLVVALSVVRRHRPDAQRYLLWAALLGLLQALVGPDLGTLLSQTRALGLDSGAMLSGQALLRIVGTLLHAVVFVLLLKGITRLARPIKSLPAAEERPSTAE